MLYVLLTTNFKIVEVRAYDYSLRARPVSRISYRPTRTLSPDSTFKTLITCRVLNPVYCTFSLFLLGRISHNLNFDCIMGTMSLVI